MLNPGQILQQKYRIENKLDKGGMGLVYKVTHLTLGRSYALKAMSELSKVPAEQAGYAEQFALEARILASLDHPGLTRVIDFFSDESTSYLVMELVEGVTLTRYVEQALAPLPQATVDKLAAQALDILDYLHRADPPVIVRDIKPDNLMLTPDGRLKLIDFGLAKRLVEGQQTQTIVRGMGTDLYAPMEQYGDGATDGRSDLFALASTLYFALTGGPPPPLWKRVSLGEKVPSPLALNATADPVFWKGLELLLEIDMKARPANAALAREALGLDRASPTTDKAPSSPTNLLGFVPHGNEYRLASSEGFYPFGPGDWILKTMQAATLARAREVRVTQTRAVCRVSLAIPASSIPDPSVFLQALSSDVESSEHPWLDELACGLKMVGEFRGFRLTLDNWSRSWLVACQAGTLQASPGPSGNMAGVTLEVDYVGKGIDRARQSAEESVQLARKTRLCPFPLYLDDRLLEPARAVEKPLFTGPVREVYLASISVARDGATSNDPGVPPAALGSDEPWTGFISVDRLKRESHLDLRCYLEPALGSSGSNLGGFAFLHQPLKLLWYRHGVLCGYQQMTAKKSLEVMAHLDGSRFPANASGLALDPPELMFAQNLSALSPLEKILPVVEAELEKYRPPKPEGSTSMGKAAAGVVAAPLLVFLLGAAAGPVMLKSALAAGLLQKAAALGGMAGYLHRDREEEALRKACLKAVGAYQLKKSV